MTDDYIEDRREHLSFEHTYRESVLIVQRAMGIPLAETSDVAMQAVEEIMRRLAEMLVGIPGTGFRFNDDKQSDNNISFLVNFVRTGLAPPGAGR